MTETGKHKRIQELYDALVKKGEIKKKADFEKLLGKSHTYADWVLKGNKNGMPFHLTEDLVTRLESKVGLNPDWYETGTGPMFTDKLSITNDTPTLYELKRDRVYVVNESAFAGYTIHKSDPTYIRTLPHEEMPLDLVGRGPMVKISVYGDSMAPNFNSGEFVYCSRFEYSDFMDFQMKLRNGLVYLVIIKGRDPMLKRILHKTDEDFITCISDNEDQVRYKPFTAKLKDVEQMWYVERKYGGQFPPPKFLMNPELQDIPARVKRLETDMGDVKGGINRILEKLA